VEWKIRGQNFWLEFQCLKFRHAQKSKRALKELPSSLDSNIAVTKVSMVVWVYGGGYAASAMACGGLAYLIWT
jgi:hypothetical protein